MKKIYLIRHGQSQANAMQGSEDVVIYKNADIPLTELGQAQAVRLSDWLLDNIHDVSGVFVSPYLRTQQTAAPYLQKLTAQNTDISTTVLEDLHEFNYLAFENIKGKDFVELKRLADEFWAKNDIHHQDGVDSDSFWQFFEQISRVRAFFAQQADGTYVVFGHGFWIGVLLWQLVGRGVQGEQGADMVKFRQFELLVRPKNTEVFLWQFADGVETIAKVRHLGG